jgi:uncharacterized protein
MDPRFMPHNTHLDDPASFKDRDPNLRQLKRHVHVHRSSLLDRLPAKVPGIYTLGGGRQIGKTTLVKQWMNDLLCAGTEAERIFYLTGELVDDHHSLVRLISDGLAGIRPEGVRYVIIDEITYVRDWDKGIKYLADAGFLEDVVTLLTGSDLHIIREARVRFPGRRGVAEVVDFHLYPLSFQEAVRLKRHLTADERSLLMMDEIEPNSPLLDMLYEEFDLYLMHGGFLTAINDMERHGRMMPASLAVYSDWIRGDVIKRGKQEHYLREILGSIIKRYGSQVTWNALASDLSIDHPKTVADYVELLASMDAVFIQAALLEDKLTGAPKKARKLMFSDPFIFHAINAWINPGRPISSVESANTGVSPDLAGRLVESCVATHYRRYFPTYYIKGAGEVDIAYVYQNRFYPVEVKWTSQLRPKSLKQIVRYPNSRILTRTRRRGTINGVPTEPLPLALFRLGE